MVEDLTKILPRSGYYPQMMARMVSRMGMHFQTVVSACGVMCAHCLRVIVPSPTKSRFNRFNEDIEYLYTAILGIWWV